MSGAMFISDDLVSFCLYIYIVVFDIEMKRLKENIKHLRFHKKKYSSPRSFSILCLKKGHGSKSSAMKTKPNFTDRGRAS